MRRYSNAEAHFMSQGGYAAESEAAAIASSLGLPERILAQNLGAREYRRVREGLRDSLLFMVIAVAAAWLVLALGQGWIVRAFSAEGQAAELIHVFCTWLAASFFFVGALLHLCLRVPFRGWTPFFANETTSTPGVNALNAVGMLVTDGLCIAAHIADARLRENSTPRGVGNWDFLWVTRVFLVAICNSNHHVCI